MMAEEQYGFQAEVVGHRAVAAQPVEFSQYPRVAVFRLLQAKEQSPGLDRSPG